MIYPLTMFAQSSQLLLPQSGGAADLRRFAPGDEQNWAEIMVGSGEFPNKEAALDAFGKEFGGSMPDIFQRCYFAMLDEACVGTVMAWRGEFDGRPCGRLHWLSVKEAYQGRSIGKQLLLFALDKLKQEFEGIYLTTSTKSMRAISMYLNYGFMPADTEAERAGWEAVAAHTGHARLEALLHG